MVIKRVCGRKFVDLKQRKKAELPRQVNLAPLSRLGVVDDCPPKSISQSQCSATATRSSTSWYLVLHSKAVGCSTCSG